MVKRGLIRKVNASHVRGAASKTYPFVTEVAVQEREKKVARDNGVLNLVGTNPEKNDIT